MFITFLVALVLITIIDFLWLGVLMSSFYVSELGDLGRTVDGEFKARLIPAALVYVLLAFGLTYFVLNGSAEELKNIFIRGALLGLMVYGIYDMTNMATLVRWPLKMTIVDIAWGSVLCGSVALLTHLIRAKLLN